MTINSLLERFSRFSFREKSMFIGIILILAWATWDKLIYQPLMDSKKQVTIELASIKTQLSVQKIAADEIETSGKNDLNQVNKQKLQGLKADLKKLKKQLNSGEKKFVPAHLMAEVLRDMLKQNSGLKLIKLETLPVTNFLNTEQIQSWVYRHGLSLTLSGNYFNTLNYLKSLEDLPWRFNWDMIEYEVKEYPIAETTLKIYTLSFEENWLGL